jgi:hypothetical protein
MSRSIRAMLHVFVGMAIVYVAAVIALIGVVIWVLLK